MKYIKPQKSVFKLINQYNTKYLSLFVFVITALTIAWGLYALEKLDDATLPDSSIITNKNSANSPEKLNTNTYDNETDSSWKDDPIWYDGKAEYAVYDATRIIYGKPRNYEAVMITNKQKMDPQTTTKAQDWRNPDTFEVFKHNVREVIPTDNYDYKFLTTSFIGTSDLKPYKLVMSSQEDCGATYKQYVVQNNKLLADQYVYFPAVGHINQQYNLPSKFQFYDSLFLTLRNHTSVTKSAIGDSNQNNAQSIMVLPDQTDTHETRYKPCKTIINYIGEENITLNDGSQINSQHLKVTLEADGATEAFTADFWFAADNSPQWLHILVKYSDQAGQTYLLKSNKRWAYWERN